MRYRKLDADGDYTFGRGMHDFHTDVPEAVAQAVKTRLGLWRGDWFLDKTLGTPYNPAILGMHTMDSYDPAVRERILGTRGLRELEEYESILDKETRRLEVVARIDTVYGPARIQEIL